MVNDSGNADKIWGYKYIYFNIYFISNMVLKMFCITCFWQSHWSTGLYLSCHAAMVHGIVGLPIKHGSTHHGEKAVFDDIIITIFVLTFAWSTWHHTLWLRACSEHVSVGIHERNHTLHTRIWMRKTAYFQNRVGGLSERQGGFSKTLYN